METSVENLYVDLGAQRVDTTYHYDLLLSLPTLSNQSHRFYLHVDLVKLRITKIKRDPFTKCP